MAAFADETLLSKRGFAYLARPCAAEPIGIELLNRWAYVSWARFRVAPNTVRTPALPFW